MTVKLNDESQIKRMSQLTQKTNQYNLTTRRYQESELQKFVQDDDWAVFHFALRDSFGDSGLVGVALVNLIDAETAALDTFLMSCRVIGRQAEIAFLRTIVEYLHRAEVKHFQAEYLPTVKNPPIKDFLPDNGFQLCSDGSYMLDLEFQTQTTSKLPPITVSKDF